jgi:hypothetical protein
MAKGILRKTDASEQRRLRGYAHCCRCGCMETDDDRSRAAIVHLLFSIRARGEV